MPDGSEKPVTFASRTLSLAKKNYSQLEKKKTCHLWDKYFPSVSVWAQILYYYRLNVAHQSSLRYPTTKNHITVSLKSVYDYKIE